jgi:maleylacetate reductase
MLDSHPHPSFTSEWARTRVVFGAGALEDVPRELERLEVERPLIVTTPGRAAGLDSLSNLLGRNVVGVCDLAAAHVPVERVLAATAVIDQTAPDALLAIGGGSALGLAKAAALKRRLPIVAVPTTYAGSEMTSVWGITEGGVKRTGRDPLVAARLVVYDPNLTLSLPVDVSGASGMNAMAHAVEAMYAPQAGPIATAAAEDALTSLARALPRVAARPDDLESRTLALRGAHAAGVACELAVMGLHHKICHVLGGTFGLPHAATHAAVLRHVVAFNASAASLAVARIADALGAPEAAAELGRLLDVLGLSRSLEALGLRADDIDRAATLVAAGSYVNPRPVTFDDVRELLLKAF